MSAGRWLRNKGFAYTADQKLARWDDIVGPRRFEKWSLQGPWQLVASRLLLFGPAGAAATFVMRWLLDDVGSALPAAGGWLLGTILVGLVAGHRMWKRERGLYDHWLDTQRRRQAAAGAATAPAREH